MFLKHSVLITCSFLTLTLTAIPTSVNAGDINSGKAIAERKCGKCHDLSPNQINEVGPALWGVFGYPAGQRPDYEYSKAFLKAVKEKQIIWGEETLAHYLREPKKFIPAGRMSFKFSLKGEENRLNVISYLKTLSPGVAQLTE